LATVIVAAACSMFSIAKGTAVAVLQVHEKLGTTRVDLSRNGGSIPASVNEDLYDDLDQDGSPDNLDDDMLDDIASKLG
jgi:hypothetical protein